MRHWLVLAGLLLIVGCGKVRQADGLVASIATDRADYAAGDTLYFWPRFSNPTAESVSLSFISIPIYEVTVRSLLGTVVIYLPTVSGWLATTPVLAPGGDLWGQPPGFLL